MSDSDGPPQRDDRHHRRSRSRSPVSPGCTGETLAEREERRLAEAAVPVGPPAGQPRAAPADTGPSTQEEALAAQAASPAAPPLEGAPGAQGAVTAAPASRAAASTAAFDAPPARGKAPERAPGASPGATAAAEESREGARGAEITAPVSRATAPAGHTAAPSTPRARGTDPARAQGASPGAATAAAVGREGAKYRTHASPTHTHTSHPKPFPPKPCPAGRTRHVRPPAPERSPPGVTLSQLRRQQDARGVIREGGDSAPVGQGTGHESAGWGAGGDRVSAQGQTQRAGLGARGKERGRKRGEGTEASGSEGGQSMGSGRHDAGQGAGRGHGHLKGTQGREQCVKAGSHEAQGVGRDAVSERGRS